MNTRVNAFAELKDVPAFEPKRTPETEVAKQVVDRIAAENNFPSRQATKSVKEPRRKQRVYTTGRNQQLNIRATARTVERFIALADEKRMPSGALLELALDALERPGASE